MAQTILCVCVFPASKALPVAQSRSCSPSSSFRELYRGCEQSHHLICHAHSFAMVLYDRGFIISCFIPSFIAIQGQSHRGQNGLLSMLVPSVRLLSDTAESLHTTPPGCAWDAVISSKIWTKNDSQLRAQKSLSTAFGSNRLNSGRNKSETIKPCGWNKTKRRLRLLDFWLATAQLRAKKEKQLGANDEDLTPCDWKSAQSPAPDPQLIPDVVELTVDQTHRVNFLILSPLPWSLIFQGIFSWLPIRNCARPRLWCRRAVMPTTWSFSQACNWIFAPEALLAPNLSDLTLKLSEIR